MWLYTNKAFISIVDKDCSPDELLVQARVKKHITNLFPGAKVYRTPNANYAYRARVLRDTVKEVISDYIDDLDYDILKNSIHDDQKFHDVCAAVWIATYQLQRCDYETNIRANYRSR